MEKTIKLLLGDCIEVLRTLPDNSIDSIVTDPPYGLEFMGKEWDTFKEGRIAKYKEGGKVDLELMESRKGKGGAGPSYTKRAAAKCRNCGKQRWSGSPCKCEEPDFEIDNSTQHTFQSFTEAWAIECYRVLKPGGHFLAFGGSRMYHRLACGVEDAGFEIRDQIMWVYGSGFPKSLNIGKTMNKIGIEHDYDGYGTALKPSHEPIVMARKPLSEKSIAENVLKHGTGGINIDGSRIGTDDIKTNGWGDKGFVAGEDYEGNTHQGRWPANIIFDEEAGQLLDKQSDKASRFFYCPKTSKKDRNEGLEKPSSHPTVKPTDLMRYLVNLVTPEGGTVLDPFMGSGSTGKAAVRAGFNFIGIEKEQEYMDIAEARINHEKNKPVQGELY